MASAELTLASQATCTNGGLTSSGIIYSGDPDSSGAAAALRFALPVGFDETQKVLSAILNLYVKRTDSEGDTDQRHSIGVLNASAQDLPTTESGVKTATQLSPVKSIGFGTFDPALDHTVATSYGWIAIDLSGSFDNADDAGWLDDGFVVVLIQPLDFDTLGFISADGLGDTNPPTIDFEYDTDPGEILADLEYTLGDTTLQAEAIVGPIGTLEATLDDVTLVATGDVAERFATLDLTLDDVTLVATGSPTAQADLAVTLDDVTLASNVVMFAEAELAATLDDVTLDSYVTQVDVIDGALAYTIDDVVLASDVSGVGGAFLAYTIDNVVLASEVIGPLVGRGGFFADGGLFADGGFLI